MMEVVALAKGMDEVLPPTYVGIPSSEIVMVDEDEYWHRQAKDGKAVKPLKKRCMDCAITTGFYVDHAKSLMEQPKEIQKAVLERWFCHNHCNRGCKGAREFLQVEI